MGWCAAPSFSVFIAKLASPASLRHARHKPGNGEDRYIQQPFRTGQATTVRTWLAKHLTAVTPRETVNRTTSLPSTWPANTSTGARWAGSHSIRRRRMRGDRVPTSKGQKPMGYVVLEERTDISDDAPRRRTVAMVREQTSGRRLPRRGGRVQHRCNDRAFFARRCARS
jgi:hypothetical protein